MELQLILLDTPIIVSNEEIKEGDKCYHIDLNKGEIDTVYDKTKYHTWTDNGVDKDRMFRKIIAGLPELPQINWNGLESEFGYVDVEKLANNTWDDNHITERRAYQQGFKKAQELNDKKSTLEDMKEAMKNVSLEILTIDGELNSGSPAIVYKWIKRYIESLPKHRAFSIEVEMESYYDDLNKEQIEQIEKELGIYGHDQGLNERELEEYAKKNPKFLPKITDGKIKIVRKL